MDKLIPAFETTLFDPTLSDACLDIAELGIDSLLDEGLFKSIPVVSLLVGVGKTAQNVHDRNLLKQTIKFINTFNQRSISQEKINKYRNKLESQSSPNLCVNSSSSYISPSMLPLSSGDLIEWSLVCHSTLSYQRFCD